MSHHGGRLLALVFLVVGTPEMAVAKRVKDESKGKSGGGADAEMNQAGNQGGGDGGTEPKGNKFAVADDEDPEEELAEEGDEDVFLALDKLFVKQTSSTEKALYEMDGDDPLMKLKGWRCCCDKPNRQFDNNRVTKLVNQISAAKDRSNQCRLFSVKKCGKVLTTTEENKWVTGGDLHYFEDTYVENPAEKSTCNLPAAKVQDIVTTVSAMKFFEAGNEDETDPIFALDKLFFERTSATEKALDEMDGDDLLMKLKQERCCCDKPKRQLDSNLVATFVDEIRAPEERSNQCKLFKVKKCGDVLVTTHENRWVLGKDLHYFGKTYVNNPSEKSTCNLEPDVLQDLLTEVSDMEFLKAGNVNTEVAIVDATEEGGGADVFLALETFFKRTKGTQEELEKMDGDDLLQKLNFGKCCCDKRVSGKVFSFSGKNERSNKCGLFAVTKCGPLTSIEATSWITGQMHYFAKTYVDDPKEKGTCNLPAIVVQAIVTRVNAMGHLDAWNVHTARVDKSWNDWAYDVTNKAWKTSAKID